MTEFLTSQFGFSLVLAAVVFGVIQLCVAYCIWLERKLSAWVQDRRGPNRVGFCGLLQPIADGIKFLVKEDFIPRHVDRALFVFAPGLMYLLAGIAFVVIPWGGRLDVSTLPWLGASYGPGERFVDVQVASINIGLLYILAVLSLGVYGIVLGGWSSRNKYSFYGAMRACAQMISYEIPLGLCVLVIVLTAGSLELEPILSQQVDSFWHWNVFKHPLVCLILFITALAEANRTPFDLSEAEQELVGGYHTEYGALKFGLFFLAEYASMITTSAMMVVMFFGGWHLPFVSAAQAEATTLSAVIVKMLILGVKVALFIALYMWIRWSLPRFRFDQLMRLAWRGLVPMTLALFALTVVLLYFGLQRSVVWCLASDLVVLIVALVVAGRWGIPITGRQANMPPVEDQAGATATGFATG